MIVRSAYAYLRLLWALELLLLTASWLLQLRVFVGATGLIDPGQQPIPLPPLALGVG